MTAPLPRDIARRLPDAMHRLRARLRAESAPTDRRWTWSQITTLRRISKEGPTTASALAAAEHVRPQSMAETVAALLREELVTRSSDPADGRKALISITQAGSELLSSIPAIREAWLEAAIQKTVSESEQRTLVEAAGIMERLADS